MSVAIRLVDNGSTRALVRRAAKTDREKKIMDQCLALSSDVWVGLIDGELACAWGVAPPSLLSDNAYLWLYTTELAQEHQFTFVRRSQIIIKQLLEEYKVLTGICEIDARRSQRWLKWLGARFLERNSDYVNFEIRRAE